MIPKEALLRKLEPYLLPAIIVLIGLSAFGLGRLSAVGGEGPKLIINMPDGSTQTAGVYQASQNVPAGEAPNSAEAATGKGQYVASKSGTKYYLATCSGVARIKDENKVYFASAAQAEAAGYSPAANCPGL